LDDFLSAGVAAARFGYLLGTGLAAPRGDHFLRAGMAPAQGLDLLVASLTAAGGRQLLVASVTAAGLRVGGHGGAADKELVQAFRALDLFPLENRGDLALVTTERTFRIDLHGATWPDG